MASRVLDLDLDFFADRILHRPDTVEAASLEPWKVEEFSRFLESRCGLSSASPLPGRFIGTHDEVLQFWSDLQTEGVLETPFEVVHVDAHADLGFGQWGALELLGHFSQSIMPLSPAERASVMLADDRVCENNYLLYAAAARWIRHLQFVPHPSWGRDDVPREFVRSSGSGDSCLLMAQYSPAVLTDNAMLINDEPLPYESADPPIPFEVVPASKLLPTPPFAAVSLARSPGYGPFAPSLVAAFMSYISPV